MLKNNSCVKVAKVWFTKHFGYDEDNFVEAILKLI